MTKLSKDIFQYELKILIPPYGDILDVFELYSMEEEWYTFKMVIYEKGIGIISPNGSITKYHIEVLRNSDHGTYESLIKLLERVIENTCTYPGCSVKRESILSLKAKSLLTSDTYDMDNLLEAIVISVRGE